MKTINQPIEKYRSCAYCECLTNDNFCTRKKQEVMNPLFTTCRDPKPKGIISKSKPRVLRSLVPW